MTHRARTTLIALTVALLAGGASGAATPGEATNLLVTGLDPSSGELSIQFDPACSATDHHIEFGLLHDVGVPIYSGQVCGIGTSGTYQGFAPGNDLHFFVVVGDDAGTEGSYGTSFIQGTHTERLENLSDPSCSFVQDLSGRCDVPSVDLTAHRPQAPPFQRRAVPEDEEVVPGVGIRINGDDDNGNATPDSDDASVPGEDDLIEVTLTASLPTAPPGLEYALVRTQGDVRAWTDANKGTELFGGSGDASISFTAGPVTLWLEKPTAGNSGLELVARRIDDLSVVASDAVNLYSFTGIVIALGGEDQVPADPPLEPSNHGTFQVAIDLVLLGYDVHMYDEDVVSGSGAGAAYDETVSAIRDRSVTGVAIYGYSHGGGSTNDLARRLDQNRGTIGSFSIDFTGYVDGIDNDSDIDIGTENALPPATGYHANYYENPGCGFFALCGGPIAGADFDLSVNTTPWGAGLDHFTVDDAPEVKQGLIDQLILEVAP